MYMSFKIRKYEKGDETKMTLEQDILSRRTFAIISHPDAGKTTITEKLLLFGGAIRDAGTGKDGRSRLHGQGTV